MYDTDRFQGTEAASEYAPDALSGRPYLGVDRFTAIYSAWWTGEPIPGNYIIQSEFLEDLKALDRAKTLTIRMHSVGGDKAQVSIYKRKCKLSDMVISNMMAKTTYMTGAEALEKGFADKVLEDATRLDIAASADGRSLFVNERQMHLVPGMFAPDNIPTVKSGVVPPG